MVPTLPEPFPAQGEPGRREEREPPDYHLLPVRITRPIRSFTVDHGSRDGGDACEPDLPEHTQVPTGRKPVDSLGPVDRGQERVRSQVFERERSPELPHNQARV